MLAAYYEKKGAAWEVLQVGELPEPRPGPGEVRVRIRYSAVNPSDTKARGAWNGDQTMRWPRIVPHQDGAGIIEAVGPGVTRDRLGERVWVYEAQWNRPSGTAAQQVVVPGENAVALPQEADLETGASLGIPAMTAHRCLFADGPIAGQTILVAGGGGAVGNAALQLASWGGARAIATISRPEQAEAAREAGAALVIDRKREDVAERVNELTHGEGVDRVVEVAFQENLEADRSVLKPGGVIAAYASGPPDSAPEVPFRAFLAKGITVRFVLVYVMAREAHAAAVRDITAALAARRYRARIGVTFALEDVVEAHVTQERGRVVGKVLVEVP